MGAPQDPIGTVRATDGVLAIRGPASGFGPDADSVDLSWFIVDIGRGEDLADMSIEEIHHLLANWPIVYQPGSIAQVSFDGEVVAVWPG